MPLTDLNLICVYSVKIKGVEGERRQNYWNSWGPRSSRSPQRVPRCERGLEACSWPFTSSSRPACSPQSHHLTVLNVRVVLETTFYKTWHQAQTSCFLWCSGKKQTKQTHEQTKLAPNTREKQVVWPDYCWAPTRHLPWGFGG